MKRPTKLRTLLTLLTPGLFLLPAMSAHATVVSPINLAESVARSSTIAEVKIESTERLPFETGWGDRYTATTIDLLSGDGEKQADTITWTQYRFTEHSPVAAMPTFKPGERVLIFLPPKAEDSPFQAPLGLGQGTYRIEQNPETKSDVATNGFANMTLFQRMDVPSLAVAIHEKMTKREAAKAEEGEATPVPVPERLHLNLLQGERGGIPLDLLKDAIRAIKSHKGDDTEKAFTNDKAEREPLRVPIPVNPDEATGN
ncbi:MAG: hypothetical protein JJU11_12705 [Candidatus Sumerlaeia bacterium]|nr:hypothetical protein [Candidatus Sumerlaeia bacterium]